MPMKVLITTSTFPVGPGDGRPRFILDLARAIADNNVVSVLAPHLSGASRSEEVEGISVRRFRYFLPQRAQILTSGAGVAANIRASWVARLQIPFFMAAQLGSMSVIIRRFRPDVVNCHWLVPQGLSAALLRRFARCPIILHVHAADVYLLQRFRWGAGVARFVVRRSDVIYADGSHVRDALDALLGFSSGALLRPMGVSVSMFSPATGVTQPTRVPGRVVFVGRLVEKKGVVYLIRALALVRHQLADTHLVVIGSGPLESDLKTEADRLGLLDHVVFLGSLGHDAVVAQLHQADLACVPSIIDSMGETEGMPTVVLEAMASGTKVVGSEVDGIPDVLKDRVNGWLARPADPDSLASVMIEALASSDGDRIAENGLDTAQNHDWRSVGSAYLTPLQGSAGHDS